MIKEEFNEYFNRHTDYIAYKNDSGGSSTSSFDIVHYAGKVKYDGTNIAAKSKDILCKCLIECMQKSEDNFISDLFLALPAPNGSFSK